MQITSQIQNNVTGAMTKTGSGTLVLSYSNNTYSGVNNINGGIVQANGDGALGTASSMAFNGGELYNSSSGAITTSKTITLNGTGYFRAGYGDAITLNGAVSGAGGLTVTYDSGSVVLGVAGNTYSGTTTIGSVGAAGDSNQTTAVLVMGAGNALPSGSGKGNVTFGSATSELNLNGYNTNVNGLSGGGVVTNSGSGTPSFTVGNNNQTSTFSGVIKTSLSLTKTGTGTLTLSGSDTYTGGTTISAGTLTVDAAGLLGGGNYSGNISISSNALFNDVSMSGQTRTLSGTISGGGSLTETGSGTLVLAGSNTFSGGATVKSGVLRGQASGSAFGAGSITIGDSGGSANATVNGNLSGTFTNSITVASGNTGTASLTANGGPTFTGLITLNSHNLTLSDHDPTLNLTLGGGVTGSGNLSLNNNNSTGSIILQTGSINNTGSITNTGTTASLISAVIGPNVTGVVENSVSSQLTLSGSNTYSTGTTLTAGLLTVGINSTTSGSGPTTTISNGATGTGLLTANGGTLVLRRHSLAVGGLSGLNGTIASSSTGAGRGFEDRHGRHAPNVLRHHRRHHGQRNQNRVSDRGRQRHADPQPAQHLQRRHDHERRHAGAGQ